MLPCHVVTTSLEFFAPGTVGCPTPGKKEKSPFHRFQWLFAAVRPPPSPPAVLLLRTSGLCRPAARPPRPWAEVLERSTGRSSWTWTTPKPAEFHLCFGICSLGAGLKNSVAWLFYAGFRNFQWKENYRFVWIGMEQ